MAAQLKIKSESELVRILESKVPGGAVAYCRNLYRAFPFQFIVSGDRRSKTGDYKFEKKRKEHFISVNGTLNPYAFLITYIHEVAHLKTFAEHGRNVQSHGIEWKSTFRALMLPISYPSVFPENVLQPLLKHLKNPKASTYSDPNLVRELRKHSITNGYDSSFELNELSEGEVFILNKKRFRKIEKRRTRTLCKDVISGRKYLIHGVTLVNKQ